MLSLLLQVDVKRSAWNTREMGDAKGFENLKVINTQPNTSFAGFLQQEVLREQMEPFDISLAVNMTRLMIAVVGILANGILFTVFGLFPIFNIPSNHFILSLAINDVMSLTYDILFIFIHYVTPGLESEIPCMVSNVGIYFVIINITQLAAIAFERFLFIRRPLHYYQLITQWKVFLILGSWWVDSSFL